jgi:hypothetical protein
MYREQANPIVETQTIKHPTIQEKPNLFSPQAEEPKPLSSSSPFSPFSSTHPPPSPITAPSFYKPENKPDRHIEKVIILYNDGTFVST